MRQKTGNANNADQLFKTLSVLVLSYNRAAALAATLRGLAEQGVLDAAEVIVADNASNDTTAEMVRREFPRVRFLQMDTNLGVEAFNRAAAVASGDVFLILDDDACPRPSGLAGAMELLEREPRVAGVALLPRHPRTGVSEWPFAKDERSGWPVMGCGNLVRAAAWRAVGGYEAAFFLYRNDVDLALKLLAAGHEVRFDPAWEVLHDSPGATRKGERWLELATRNWLWLARRHGRGFWKWWGGAAGVARALVHAGPWPRRLACVVRGAWAGVAEAPPVLNSPRPNGRPWRAFLSARGL